MTETFLKFLQKNLKINITYLFRPLNSNNIIYQIRIKNENYYRTFATTYSNFNLLTFIIII